MSTVKRKRYDVSGLPLGSVDKKDLAKGVVIKKKKNDHLYEVRLHPTKGWRKVRFL